MMTVELWAEQPEIKAWLANRSSKLDFSPVHSQHVLERKEGSGDISPSVKSFCEKFVEDRSNDTWWLKGACEHPASTKIQNSR